jgi:peptidoglycan/xylan/chitin deacetylase (PgdA/CDA1 family)
MNGERGFFSKRAISIGVVIAAVIIAVVSAALFFRHNPSVSDAWNGNVLVLLYHTFSEEPVPDPALFTTAEKFERDITILLENGLRSLSAYDFAEGNYSPDGRYFIITLDDGYLTNYEVAFPILKKLNCHAVIFKNTDNDYMEHHFCYEQSREMEASGLISVQSHLPLHEYATRYEPDEFVRQLNKSFDTLERELGERRFRLFAYPYGDYNLELFQAAEAQGVALQFVQTRLFDAPGLVMRVNISFSTNIEELLR